MTAPGTVQLLTFELSGGLFGLEVERVQEVLCEAVVTPVPLGAPGLAGLLNLRGEVIPAVDLGRRLGLAARAAGTVPLHLVVRTAAGPVSLLVDSVGDVVAVPPESFTRIPHTVPAARDDAAAAVPGEPGAAPGTAMLAGAYQLPGALLVRIDVDRAVALTPAP